jgi:hypothetical protein
MARNKKLKEPTAGTVGVVDTDAEQIKRFEERRGWFNMEWNRQEANRYQMALDEDYYDSLQWTEEEARAVRARGQNPVVHNEVKPMVDFLLGTERRMRRDFKVLARTNKAPEATSDAETKTNLLKYLNDVNRAPFSRSQAADDQIKAGMGWLELGIDNDPEKEPIYLGAESWRCMLHDSISGERNPDKWRYEFRFKEIDLDVAKAYFPGKEEDLERASNAGIDDSSGGYGWGGIFPSMGLLGRANMPAKYIQFDENGWMFNPRKRVLLIECWDYRPTKETTREGAAPRVKMRMHVSIMTRLGMILEAESPYRHNRFPFIPVWCYRRKRDGLPYGVIRAFRGPQDDLNKRMSKALFEASSRQLRIEKSAYDPEVMDLDDLREEENSPDGISVYSDGALSGNRVQAVERKSDAAAQLQLAEANRQSIRLLVPMETRGAQSNVVAAKGIIAKQEAASTITAEIFDSQFEAHQIEGELTLSLIEQFYTEEKTFSVTGERFKLDYFTINAPDPANPGRKLNDVTRCRAQFVIGEQPWRQALAEAAFESAMEMLGQLAPVAPNIVAAIIDLVFEWSDLPNKNLILQRIRQATGQSDPDQGDTPEQQAQKQKQAALAQMQFNAEIAMLRAQVKEAEAKGEKLDAEKMAKQLETIYMSAQAAQIAMQVPGAMVVADQLLESVGFVDQSGQGTGAVVPNTAPAQPAQPAPGAAGAPIPDAQQADGAMRGIGTPAPDGVPPTPAPDGAINQGAPQ